jgi:hypothetical protein
VDNNEETVIVETLIVRDEATNENNGSRRNEEPMQFDSNKAFERLNQRIEEDGIRHSKAKFADAEKVPFWNSGQNMLRVVGICAISLSIAMVAYMLWA